MPRPFEGGGVSFMWFAQSTHKTKLVTTCDSKPKSVPRGTYMLAWIKANTWDIAHYVATLTGWVMLTSALSETIPGPVWRYSAGLFLLGFVGIRVVGTIAWVGLFYAMQSDNEV